MQDLVRVELAIYDDSQTAPGELVSYSEYSKGLTAMGPVHKVIDTLPAMGGAYQLPSSASFRISLSSVKSETALRNRLFSFSKSCRRFT